MTEVNQADLFTGRAPVDEDLTPAQRMRMIRRPTYLTLVKTHQPVTTVHG
jgi:hypothetical protein